MKRGLVLGKFAPLHAGHQHLIETAMRATDELVVLIYDCPELIDVPLSRRAAWIRTLYPRVKVIEGVNGPRETGHEPWIMRLQEGYVRKMVTDKITHFFSSEWYGEHMSISLGAEDVRVDMDRSRFPISGSIIRADAFRHRKFVHPVVYRDLIKKVVFLGAESTGKTTIAEKLAELYQTKWMPEYGREFWERHQVGGKLSPEQLIELAIEHLAQEEELLLESNRFLFVDTNALTTAMFCRHYHGFVPTELEALAVQAERRYEYVFLCGDDIPYFEDGTRSGAEHRHRFQSQISADLTRRDIPSFPLSGNLQTRIERVGSVLSSLKRIP